MLAADVTTITTNNATTTDVWNDLENTGHHWLFMPFDKVKFSCLMPLLVYCYIHVLPWTNTSRTWSHLVAPFNTTV